MAAILPGKTGYYRPREERKNMSCRYACTCGGACCSCSSHDPEHYLGEAEDLLSQQLGYRDYDHHMSSRQQQEDTRQQDMEGPEEKQATPRCEHNWNNNRFRTCKKCGALDTAV